MPTSKYFKQCPPFPSDVPVADIPVISFRHLQDLNRGESERVFEASREHGFFILDLTGSEDGERLLLSAEKMFDIASTTFGLGQAVLNEYAYQPPHSLLGYKRAGELRTDDGKLDAVEMYALSQDDIIGNTAPRRNPEPVESHRQDCKEFFHLAHSAVSAVLSALDEQLDLPHGTLASLSPLNKPSDTSLRLLLSHPQSNSDGGRITLGGHTDIGIITLLFNVAGGLQILPADKENVNANWRYIRPLPGCAIINIGDTLVEWTGEVLRSSLHRVVTAPGAQASVPRMSLAYLVRPENDATMKRLKGGGIIPEVKDGDEEETRSVREWAAWRAKQVINGELKPQTRGGRRAAKVN